MVSTPLGSCLAKRAAFLAATGKVGEAAEVFSAMKSVPVISVETQSMMADMYANELHYIPAATSAAQRAKERINWNQMSPLLNGLGVARLPEEISDDPAWLTVWSDPKLREMMELYRANLIAFRNGK